MKTSTTQHVAEELSFREALLPPSLQNLRQKLGQKAKQQKRYRFYSLYALVSRSDVLQAAFAAVRLSLGLHHRWKRLAVDLLGLKAGERVIDVCGGTGDLAILAAKQAGEVVVYDFSRSMAEVGRGKVRRLGLTQRIRFVLGDAEAISFKKASFDAALVGFGIRNLTHPEGGLQEMHRVLKPGGRLMVLEFSQPHPAWFRRFYDLYSFSLIPLVGKGAGGFLAGLPLSA